MQYYWIIESFTIWKFFCNQNFWSLVQYEYHRLSGAYLFFAHKKAQAALSSFSSSLPSFLGSTHSLHQSKYSCQTPRIRLHAEVVHPATGIEAKLWFGKVTPSPDIGKAPPILLLFSSSWQWSSSCYWTASCLPKRSTAAWNISAFWHWNSTIGIW